MRSVRPLKRTALATRWATEAAGAKDPEAFADVYTMLVEGTLILRQVHLRNDAAKLARPVVEKLLADSIPG